jgi:hypothetical protein
VALSSVFAFRPFFCAARAALLAGGLITLAAAGAIAAEESALVIAPSPADWDAAMARLPARSQQRIRQGLPFAVDLASPDNGAVFELRSAPLPRRAVPGWKVDLPSVVAYYNGLCVSHAGLRLRLVRALTFGQWNQTAGQLTHTFRLDWTLVEAGQHPITTEGFATGPRGVNLRRHTPAERRAEATQAFARAFLLAVLRLNWAE